MGGVLAAVYTAAGGDVTADILLGIGSNRRLQWETLLGGGAAIFAALYTVRRMQAQIELTRDIEIDKRNRSARAAQSVLSLELRDLIRYSVDCMGGLAQILACQDQQGGIDRAAANVAANSWREPALPTEGLGVIKECIEFADDEVAGELSALLRHLQVQNSRMDSRLSELRSPTPGTLITRINVERDLIDAAEVHARVSCLFHFARGRRAGLSKPDRKGIRTAFNSAGLWDVELKYLTPENWEPTDYSQSPD